MVRAYMCARMRAYECACGWGCGEMRQTLGRERRTTHGEYTRIVYQDIDGGAILLPHVAELSHRVQACQIEFHYLNVWGSYACINGLLLDAGLESFTPW